MIRVVRIIATTISLYLVTHLFVFTVLPFAITLSYLDRDSIPAIKAWFVKCIFAVVGKRVKVSGRSNFDPEQRYVIVSNYPSGYAGFALMGEFPGASIVVHAFLRKIPLLGQALSRIGAVFVQSGGSGRGRRALDLHLGKGNDISNIIILPEGGITPDGKIQRFRRGFVHIQRQTSFDVLPVTLNELYKLKPFGRLYADPDAKPELVIHPAITGSAADQMNDQDLINQVRETIERVYQP